MVSQPLNSGAQPRSAVETAVLECTRGRWNSWCSGEMLRYHEEPRLRRQRTVDITDVEARRCGYQTGLDTLVVRTVNDGCSRCAPLGYVAKRKR